MSDPGYSWSRPTVIPRNRLAGTGSYSACFGQKAKTYRFGTPERIAVEYTHRTVAVKTAITLSPWVFSRLPERQSSCAVPARERVGRTGWQGGMG
jgi:hypothetical protein